MSDLTDSVSSDLSAHRSVADLPNSNQELDEIRRALRASEALYRTAFECTGTAMIIIEEDTTISVGNRRMEQIVGYTQEDLRKQMKWTEVVEPQDKERLLQYHHARRSDPSSVPSEYEFRIRNAHGEVRDVLANVSLIEGTRKSLVSIIDITERKQHEQALRESRERFKEIADLLPGIICEMDPSLRLTYVNEMGLKTFGFTRQDFEAGINVEELLPEEIRERVAQDIHNIFHNDFGNPAEYCLHTKDRRQIQVIINSAPIRRDGEIVGIRTCIIDISDRIRAEQQMKESEERFRTVFAGSPLGIALFSQDGALIETNESFRKMFTVSEPVNGTRASLDNWLSLDVAERDLLLVGSAIVREERFAAPSLPDTAPKRWYAWHMTGLAMTGTGPSMLLAQVEDITESKLAEEAKLAKEREATARAEAMVAGLRRELMDKASFHNMVSRSAQMKTIFDLLPEAAGATATVLISGESGTGKELIARSLHELSPRKGKSFVAINCGALPDNLLESELFGYKAGAFTDAKKDKPGKFALAEGGTIFLDEIGDISTAMQVKLLRVLQERSYEPLGATASVKANVRVLAATNRDLAAMVKSGAFREDLYYRIKVVTIKLPPLRDRRCDIPILCEHFIERFNDRYNKQISGMTQDAIDLLLAHDFPGNIRELENLIEHAFIFCKGPVIEQRHLPAEMLDPQALQEAKVLAGVKNFEELERMYIKSILDETGNCKIRAAERLGIHKATLFRKIKQLGIE